MHPAMTMAADFVSGGGDGAREIRRLLQRHRRGGEGAGKAMLIQQAHHAWCAGVDAVLVIALSLNNLRPP